MSFLKLLMKYLFSKRAGADSHKTFKICAAALQRIVTWHSVSTNNSFLSAVEIKRLTLRSNCYSPTRHRGAILQYERGHASVKAFFQLKSSSEDKKTALLTLRRIDKLNITYNYLRLFKTKISPSCIKASCFNSAKKQDIRSNFRFSYISRKHNKKR